MSAPLARAVEALRHALDDPNAARRVERAGADGKGALTLEVSGGAIERWFRWKDDELVELRPAEDEALPARVLVGDSELLSWRPGRRVVLRSGSALRGVVKGYRPSRLADAARRHRALERRGTDGGGTFRIPRLLLVSEVHAALVFEQIDFGPLPLGSSGSDRHLRVGLALRRMQEGPADDDLPSFTHEDELAVLDTWRARAEWATGGLPRRWRMGHDRVRSLARRLRPSEPVPAHRDLHDGQLGTAEDGRPVLLDLDLACRADRALDPANLMAHYALREMQGLCGADEEGVNACAEALLEPLRPDQPGFWTALRFYQGTSLLRLALVYALRPRWSALSVPLTDLAIRCLKDAEEPLSA